MSAARRAFSLASASLKALKVMLSIDLARRGAGPRRSGGPGHLRFIRDGEQFSPADRSWVADLAQRLGISLQLGSALRY